MRNDSSDSTLKKLLKKPAGVIALSIIIATTLIAIFAYQIAPDNTPDANRMIVELGTKKAGFTIDLLYVPKTIQQSNASEGWLSGTTSTHNAIPINGYATENKNLIVYHYIDDEVEDTISYSYSDLNVTNTDEAVALIQKHKYYLGTDRYGRDILSRLLVGSRVSISVGLIAVLLSMTIGIFLGAVAGYFGGFVDNLVMWLINILWSIPTLLLVFAITLTIGKGFWQIFIAIGLTMWVSSARLIRGQVMSIKEMEYITAAKTLGIGNLRIITRHILPNIIGPIMVIAAANFATAILIEAGLSFLGIGVQPPTPSWGLMIKEHYNFLLTNRPLLAIVPGLAILILVYAFNILGNTLRDVLDVKD